MKRGMVKLTPPEKILFEKPSLIRVNILAGSIIKSSQQVESHQLASCECVTLQYANELRLAS